MGLVKLVKRHKKKLIFLGVIGGGSYMVVRYAINQMKDLLTQSTKSLSEANQQYTKLKKYEHFLTIKQTSDQAVMELSKSVLDKIKHSLPSEDLLADLKQKPSNKLEIWGKLKIMCASRCFATIYSLSVLSAFIKVELNVIGGYLFIGSLDNQFINFDSLFNQSNTRVMPHLPEYVQQKYLENIENFIKTQLARFIQAVEESCQDVFTEINLKESVTIEILHEKFEYVHKQIKSRVKKTMALNLNDVDLDSEYYEFHEQSSISDYLLPELNQGNAISTSVMSTFATKQDHEILADLNLETFDIINSNDFQSTLDSLIEDLSNEFLNILTSLIMQEIVSVEKEKSEMVSTSLPFAKIIPIFDKTQQIFQTNNSSLFKLLDNLKLNIFSANIYEAFSNAPSNPTAQNATANNLAALMNNPDMLNLSRLLF